MDDIKFSGNLFQVVTRSQDVEITVYGNKVAKSLRYEVACRTPGVRALIIRDDKILLGYEYRYELQDWDYRLPGGKVYDSNSQFISALRDKTLIKDVEKSLIKELNEEARINVIDFELLNISKAGLTVEWDLYYFLVKNFKQLPIDSMQKSEYEFIDLCWVDFHTAFNLCMNRKISESRSAFEVMRFILMNRGETLDVL